MKIKLVVLILFVVLVVAISVYSVNHRPVGVAKQVEAPVEVVTDFAIPKSGKYCFSRTQVATTEAPYSAEEHVVLNFLDTKVTGTKSGTQAGPDMTNGYTGTLSGSTIGTEMELTYAYEVEGSKNRELEVYTFSGESLVKKRWVLKESKINSQGILVPDYVGEPQLITYNKEACK